MDPDHLQNLTDCFLSQSLPLQDFHVNSSITFVSNLTDRQTNQQTEAKTQYP